MGNLFYKIWFHSDSSSKTSKQKDSPTYQKFQAKIKFWKQWLTVFATQNTLPKILTAANWYKHPSWLLSCSRSAFRQQLQNTARILCSRAALPCPMIWAGFQISWWVALQVCSLRKRWVLVGMWLTSWKRLEMLLCAGNMVGFLGRKAGHQLKACTGTAGSQVRRRRQKSFRASPKFRIELSSWGLQTLC